MIKYYDRLIPNGDYRVNFRTYFCNGCDEEIPENYTHFFNENEVFCRECAFKCGLIKEREFLDSSGFCIDSARAGINPITNEIEIVIRGKFSWEKTNRDYRHCKEYEDWRKAVFERDNYTCVNCQKVGGTLEAHHIKTFNKYPKLRYCVSNGVTLCRKCHREAHKRK